jgi:hypothetical protein
MIFWRRAAAFRIALLLGKLAEKQHEIRLQVALSAFDPPRESTYDKQVGQLRPAPAWEPSHGNSGPDGLRCPLVQW